MMTWNALIWPDIGGRTLTDASRRPWPADCVQEPGLRGSRIANVSKHSVRQWNRQRDSSWHRGGAYVWCLMHVAQLPAGHTSSSLVPDAAGTSAGMRLATWLPGTACSNRTPTTWGAGRLALAVACCMSLPLYGGSKVQSSDEGWRRELCPTSVAF